MLAQARVPFYAKAITIITILSASFIPARQQSVNSSVEGVDDILKDTILLLDALDQKLAKVGNSTPNALMRDNLRALNGVQLISDSSHHADLGGGKRSSSPDGGSSDEVLMKLAEGFTSGRKSDDLLAVASSNPDQKATAQASPPGAQNNDPPSSKRSASKRTRLLQTPTNLQYQQESLETNQQLASDSTERHIKFTLDLMQAIFSSQLYSSKTNLIESFLISPLSIQTVLMMMHLGARGQTRRELANSLHLNEPAGGAIQMASSASANSQDKLKRRHHQQAALNSENVANKQQQQSASNNPKLPTSSTIRQQQISNAAHELFGGAVRNLLKDPIVTKALTSANQILVEKNLPLSAQYEWSIRHYYAAEIKPVDFQQQQSSSGSNFTGGSSSSGGSLPTLQQQTIASANPDKGKQHLEFLSSNTSNVATNDQTNLQQTINDWVERQTKGRISNFLSSPPPASTLMMAINVLFFKGDWQYKFDAYDTDQDAWFTQANGKKIKVPMMVDTLPLAFAHDPYLKTSVIELPYKAQRLGLFLLLPDEISGIFHLMQNLNSTSFANLISSMRKSNQSPDGIQQPISSNGINVRIPKFSIDSSPKLSQILSQQLGLKTLFTPDVADLSGIFGSSSMNKRSSLSNNSSASRNEHQTPPQVGLDELLHKAVLQVDEQGSVAAASSAAIVSRVGIFNNNYFEADHPFLIFLMDKQTGLVLFSGVYAGNSATSGQQPPNSVSNNNTSTAN